MKCVRKTYHYGLDIKLIIKLQYYPTIQIPINITENKDKHKAMVHMWENSVYSFVKILTTLEEYCKQE